MHGYEKVYFHSRSDVRGYEKRYFHSISDVHGYEKCIFTLGVTCVVMKKCEHVTTFKLAFQASMWKTLKKVDEISYCDCRYGLGTELKAFDFALRTARYVLYL